VRHGAPGEVDGEWRGIDGVVPPACAQVVPPECVAALHRAVHMVMSPLTDDGDHVLADLSAWMGQHPSLAAECECTPLLRTQQRESPVALTPRAQVLLCGSGASPAGATRTSAVMWRG